MKTKPNPVPPNIADPVDQIKDRVITAVVQEVVKNGLHGLRPGASGYLVKVEATARAAAVAGAVAARTITETDMPDYGQY